MEEASAQLRREILGMTTNSTKAKYMIAGRDSGRLAVVGTLAVNR